MSLPSFREITLMPAPWEDSELSELKEADVNADHVRTTDFPNLGFHLPANEQNDHEA